MKIDNTASTNMLYTGPMENADRYVKGKEVERLQAVDTTQSTTSAFMDNSIRGSVFDAKA